MPVCRPPAAAQGRNTCSTSAVSDVTDWSVLNEEASLAEEVRTYQTYVYECLLGFLHPKGAKIVTRIRNEGSQRCTDSYREL